MSGPFRVGCVGCVGRAGRAAWAVLLLGAILPAQRPRLESLARGDEVRASFAPVVAAANRSTVRVLVDGQARALGTTVGPGGLVITKASELVRASGGEITCSRDGQSWPAELLGTDLPTDLALLRTAADLPPVAWAEAGPLPGAFLASPDGSRLPAGTGILSAAPYVHTRQRAFLGVRFEPGTAPVTLAEVVADSGAAAAGLRPGDAITAFGGEPVGDEAELRARIAQRLPGDAVAITVRRGEATLGLVATLGTDRTGAESRQEHIWGPLSRVRRGFGLVLQHDAVLDPQLCGGPLVDLDGRAVGVNIARAGRVETLALPAATVREVAARLLADSPAAR